MKHTPSISTSPLLRVRSWRLASAPAEMPSFGNLFATALAHSTTFAPALPQRSGSPRRPMNLEEIQVAEPRSLEEAQQIVGARPRITDHHHGCYVW